MFLQQPISERLYTTYVRIVVMTNIILTWFIGKTFSLPLLSYEINVLIGIMLLAAYCERRKSLQKVAFSITTICFVSLSVILITIGVALIINGNDLLYLRYFAILPLVFLCWYGIKWRLLKF